MDDAQFAIILGKLQEGAEISRDDRRDLWTAMNALRDLVTRNAETQRDLMGKMDQAVHAMSAQAESGRKAAAQVEQLAKRVTDVETARIAEISADKAERRFLVGVATAIGAVVGPVAIWVATTFLKWLFPVLAK